MKKLIFALSLLVSGELLACQFTYDCASGARCVRELGQRYGVCMGGNFNGNQNDRQPVYNRFNATDRVGNQCVYNSQCGSNRRCVKTNGKNWGVCY